MDKEKWWTSQPSAAFPSEFTWTGTESPGPGGDTVFDARVIEQTREAHFRWRQQHFEDFDKLQRELLDTWHSHKYPLLDAAVLAERMVAAAASAGSGGTSPSAPGTAEPTTAPQDKATLRNVVWEQELQRRAGLHGVTPVDHVATRVLPPQLSPLPSESPIEQQLLVDMFGSVVARHAEPGALCGWEPAPCFPLRRGGLPTPSNLIVLHAATQHQRQELILNAVVREADPFADFPNPADADAGLAPNGAVGSAEQRGGAVTGGPQRHAAHTYLVVRGGQDGTAPMLKRLRLGPSPQHVTTLAEFVHSALQTAVLSGIAASHSGADSKPGGCGDAASATRSEAATDGIGPRGTDGGAGGQQDTAAAATATAAAVLVLDMLQDNWARLDAETVARGLPFRQLSDPDFPKGLFRTYLACCMSVAEEGARSGDRDPAQGTTPAPDRAGKTLASGGPEQPGTAATAAGASAPPSDVFDGPGLADAGHDTDAGGPQSSPLAWARAALAKALDWRPSGSRPILQQLLVSNEKDSEDDKDADLERKGTGEGGAAASGESAGVKLPSAEEIAHLAWVPMKRRPAPLSPRFSRHFRHQDRYFLWPAEPLPVPLWVLVDVESKPPPPPSEVEGAPGSEAAAGTEGQGEDGDQDTAQAEAADLNTEVEVIADTGSAGGAEADEDPGLSDRGSVIGGREGEVGNHGDAGASQDGAGAGGDPRSLSRAQRRLRRLLKAIEAGAIVSQSYYEKVVGAVAAEGHPVAAHATSGPTGMKAHPGPKPAARAEGSLAASVATDTSKDPGRGEAAEAEPVVLGAAVEPATTSGNLEEVAQPDLKEAGGEPPLPSDETPPPSQSQPASVTGSHPSGKEQQKVLLPLPLPLPLPKPGTQAPGGAEGARSEGAPPAGPAIPPALPGLQRVDPETAAQLQEEFRRAAEAARGEGKRIMHLSSKKLPGSDEAAAAAAAVLAAAKAQMQMQMQVQADKGRPPMVSAAAATASTAGGGSAAVAAPASAAPVTPSPRVRPPGDGRTSKAGSRASSEAAASGAQDSAAPPQTTPGLPGLKNLPPDVAAQIQEAFQQAVASGRRQYHLRTVELANRPTAPQPSPANPPPPPGSEAGAVAAAAGHRRSGAGAAAGGMLVSAQTWAPGTKLAPRGSYGGQLPGAVPMQYYQSPHGYDVPARGMDYWRGRPGQAPTVPPQPSKLDRFFGLLGPAGHVIRNRDEEARMTQYDYFTSKVNGQRPPTWGGSGWGSAVMGLPAGRSDGR